MRRPGIHASTRTLTTMRTPHCLATATILVLSAATAGFAAQTATSTAAPHFGTWGVDLSGRDADIKPGDDFFKYANGTWLKRTTIPEDLVRFGNFDALNILSENRVHEILEEARQHPTDATAKIGAFYAAFMDEDRAEQLGAKPLDSELAKVKDATNRAGLIEMMGRPDGLHHGLFVAGISAD